MASVAGTDERLVTRLRDDIAVLLMAALFVVVVGVAGLFTLGRLGGSLDRLDAVEWAKVPAGSVLVVDRVAAQPRTRVLATLRSGQVCLDSQVLGDVGFSTDWTSDLTLGCYDAHGATDPAASLGYIPSDLLASVKG